MSCLEEHLQDYDGKAVTLLSQAQVACRDAPGYLDDLIGLCADTRALISDGATWILKAELEAGQELTEPQRARLVAALGQIDSWQAALHLLQSVEMLELLEEEAAAFLSWADGHAAHARPFLRAWSLHARVVLGLRFPDLDIDPEAALSAADADQAGSVRARARQLRRRL